MKFHVPQILLDRVDVIGFAGSLALPSAIVFHFVFEELQHTD